LEEENASLGPKGPLSKEVLPATIAEVNRAELKVFNDGGSRNQEESYIKQSCCRLHSKYVLPRCSKEIQQ